MVKKIIPTVLIILGIGIIAYPKAFEAYNDYKLKKIMEEWEASLTIIDEGGIEQGEVTELDDGATDSLNEQKTLEEQRKRQLELEKRVRYIQSHMEGMLVIEKIKLNLPILKGATANNLNISVSSMEHSGKAGEKGNYVIAGHRSHTYGRHFNRLDELDKGDIIKINDGENEYEYTVKEKAYVLPKETEILSSKVDREITLVTCHPMINPTHRLIVKGEILE